MYLYNLHHYETQFISMKKNVFGLYCLFQVLTLYYQVIMCKFWINAGSLLTLCYWQWTSFCLFLFCLFPFFCCTKIPLKPGDLKIRVSCAMGMCCPLCVYTCVNWLGKNLLNTLNSNTQNDDTLSTASCGLYIKKDLGIHPRTYYYWTQCWRWSPFHSYESVFKPKKLDYSAT